MMLLTLLLACGDGDSAAASTAAGPPAALVEIGEARDGGLAGTWAVQGEVRALERATLAAAADGAVHRIEVREGDAVSRGDVLLTVDPALASAELAAARAEHQRLQVELELAQRSAGRVRAVRDGVLAADEVDAAEGRVRTLSAEVARAAANEQLARARLERHRVRAPFDGVIAARTVDPGAWVAPGTPVLGIVRTGDVDIRVDAPPELAAELAVGDPVELPGGSGEITGIVPALDATTRTALVRIRPAPDATGLAPGAPVRVRFAVNRRGGVVVPRDAVVANGNGERVFRVVDSAAEAIDVEVVARDEAEVLVRSERLAPGDALVTRGNERLRPGQAVRTAR